MKDVKFSIVIPVFNAEKFLTEALDSIVNQAYQNFEVIIINDGSTDSSIEQAFQYKGRIKNLKIINQINSGQGCARNVGIEHSSGDYIIFLDADDVLKKFACDKLNKFLKRNVCDVVCFYYEIYKSGKIFDGYNLFTKRNSLISEARERITHISPACWNRAWRKEFIDKFEIRFAENLFFEDALFHWHSMVMADVVDVCPDILYTYNVREGSTITSRGKHFCDIIKICDQIKKILEQENVYHWYNDLYVLYKYNEIKSHYDLIDYDLKKLFLSQIKNAILFEEMQIYIEKENNYKKIFFYLYVARFLQKIQLGKLIFKKLCKLIK